MSSYDDLKRKIAALKTALSTGQGMTYPATFGRVLSRDVENSFLSSTDPITGSSFAPLKYRRGRPLILTGLLESEAVKAAKSPTVQGGLIRASMTTPHYGKYHQHGTGRIPQRRFFGMTPQGEQEVRAAIAADCARFMK